MMSEFLEDPRTAFAMQLIHDVVVGDIRRIMTEDANLGNGASKDNFIHKIFKITEEAFDLAEKKHWSIKYMDIKDVGDVD